VRGERGERGWRGERGERYKSYEIYERGKRGERGERGERDERGERGERDERDERGESYERGPSLRSIIARRDQLGSLSIMTSKTGFRTKTDRTVGNFSIPNYMCRRFVPIRTLSAAPIATKLVPRQNLFGKTPHSGNVVPFTLFCAFFTTATLSKYVFDTVHSS
jgi:hypothetical protein